MKHIVRPNKGGKPLSLDEKRHIVEQIAAFGLELGFVLITTHQTYTNSTGRLEWEACDGTRFKIYETDLKKNGFPKDLNEYNRRSGMKDKSLEQRWVEMCGWAEQRGGTLLTPLIDYENTISEMTFTDADGNLFTSNYQKMARGYWSPYERSGIGENVTRQVFQHIFKIAFPSRWDIVPSQKRGTLQLDGFAELPINDYFHSVAFEYQGHQGHRSDCEVIERDRFKAEFCDKNRILLVVVPLISQNIIWNDPMVYDFVAEIIATAIPCMLPDIEKARSSFVLSISAITRQQLKLERASEIGRQFGFDLVSNVVRDDKSKLEWVCWSTGTTQLRSLKQIKRSGWPKPKYGP